MRTHSASVCLFTRSGHPSLSVVSVTTTTSSGTVSLPLRRVQFWERSLVASLEFRPNIVRGLVAVELLLMRQDG